MVKLVLLPLIHCRRPGSYEAHISFQNIPELRKFIQGCLSDKMSYSFDDSWIIVHFEHHSIFYVILFHQFFFAFFCIHIHGAEFIDLERTTVLSHADL